MGGVFFLAVPQSHSRRRGKVGLGLPAAPRVVSTSAGIDRLGGGGDVVPRTGAVFGRGEWALVSICTGSSLSLVPVTLRL